MVYTVDMVYTVNIVYTISTVAMCTGGLRGTRLLYCYYTILVKNFNCFQHSELKFPVSDQFHWRGPWPQYINFSPTESNGNDWLVKNQNAVYGNGIIGQISSPKQFWKQKKRYLKWLREVFQKNKMETPLFYFATESHIRNGFYTWSQSKISLLSPLIIGSKLTFSGWSDLWLPYSALFRITSDSIEI